MAQPQQRRGRSKQDYRTPVEFLIATKAFLGIEDFDWDLAADDENAVTDHYYSVEEDALTRPWRLGDGWNWLNPPFAFLRPWVERAYLQMLTARAQTSACAGGGRVQLVLRVRASEVSRRVPERSRYIHRMSRPVSEGLDAAALQSVSEARI